MLLLRALCGKSCQRSAVSFQLNERLNAKAQREFVGAARGDQQI
jgi:hypothetical protein